MKKLNAVLINTPEHVELMRHIYNDNLDGLATHPLPYRSYEEQQQWWNENKNCLKGYLYEPVDELGNVVAFLVLRQRAGFCTPIVAIKKTHWGCGLGQEIVHDYIEKAAGPIAGTQLQRNKPICHINSKVGWMIVGESGEGEQKIDLLYHPGINPDNKCTKEVFENILEYLALDKEKVDYTKFGIK